MANSVDPDQTAPIRDLLEQSVLGPYFLLVYLNSPVLMLGNYLQQTTSADDTFRWIFLGALRVKAIKSQKELGVYMIKYGKQKVPFINGQMKSDHS